VSAFAGWHSAANSATDDRKDRFAAMRANCLERQQWVDSGQQRRRKEKAALEETSLSSTGHDRTFLVEAAMGETSFKRSFPANFSERMDACGTWWANWRSQPPTAGRPGCGK